MSNPRSKSAAVRAAVIGSGFGGLAPAIRLQSAGIDTTLFEGARQAGRPRLRLAREGFTFDAGPTVITDPAAWRSCSRSPGGGCRSSWSCLPVTPFYRLSRPTAIPSTMRAAPPSTRRSSSPADRAGYERFVDYSKRLFDKGYTELARVPFLHFGDMLRCAPDLLRLRADRSVYSAVSRYVKDEKLRQALSFHSLLVGGNPFETSAIYSTIHYLERKWGVYFARGGPGALVSGLVKLFQSMGGALRLASPVRGVEVRGGETSCAARAPPAVGIW